MTTLPQGGTEGDPMVWHRLRVTASDSSNSNSRNRDTGSDSRCGGGKSLDDQDGGYILGTGTGGADWVFSINLGDSSAGDEMTGYIDRVVVKLVGESTPRVYDMGN